MTEHELPAFEKVIQPMFIVLRDAGVPAPDHEVRRYFDAARDATIDEVRRYVEVEIRESTVVPAPDEMAYMLFRGRLARTGRLRQNRSRLPA